MKPLTFLHRKTTTPAQSPVVCKNTYTGLWIQGILFLIILGAGCIPAFLAFQEKRAVYLSFTNSTDTQNQTFLQDIQFRKEVFQLHGEEALDASLPSEEDVIEFIESIEDAAQSHTVVEQLNFHADQKTVTGQFSMIPITLSVSGSLEDITHFFSEIEQYDYYINPISFTISGAAAGDRQQLSMEARTYWTQ